PAAAPAPDDDAPSTSPRPPATARPAAVPSPGLPAAPPVPQVNPPAAAGLDRDALEEAMTEVLRDAARQHGLEV
ncbi:2-oxoglutarate dehydrogenase, E2 component, dihydrolipoamide succinyltransferase, partial [Myxococcota bacterium]|nr:2-oxoglutarate dehydrogenase, E2 component, dihydrolipoamide succinyltransferase [Myxococcota bacterium]